MVTTYNRTMAAKAVRRLAKRTMDEKLVFIRPFLAEFMACVEPIYTGVDPKTKLPFEGENLNRYLCELVGYFGRKHLTLDSMLHHVRHGYYLAEQHERECSAEFAKKE